MSGIGHLGVGFAAKKALPKIPLVVLLLMPMLLDIIWIILSALGMNAMVWTHSLVMSLVWSALAGVITLAVMRKLKPGLIIALLVFSHWVIDLITHPMGAIFAGDTGIPLFFNEAGLVGFGLYNNIIWTVIGEAALLVPGVIVYVLMRKKMRKSREANTTLKAGSVNQ